MRRFVEEADRGQWMLLPECLEDFIDESNPVRVIDAFVDALDLGEMNFEGVEPAATGRPSYHPSEAGIIVTLPKPMTSGAKAEGRFGKQDFAYLPEEDAYRCPAGERLPYRYTTEEDDKMLRRYWATACQTCSLKSQCTPGPERRITRWEHEHLLEAVQQRLDANPEAMRQRRETVEHPFVKARMGATHFLTKTLPKVAAEMALSVLAYNLTRVMNIVGIKPLITAIVA